MRFGGGHIALGEAPNGTAVANEGLNGPNIAVVDPVAVGIATLPGWNQWRELSLGPGQAVPGGGRYMISTQGRDPAEPGTGNDTPGTVEYYFGGNAWHHHGEKYVYVFPLRVPKKSFGSDGLPVLQSPTLLEIAHADKYIDDAIPQYFGPPHLHGHEATGILLAHNRADLPQQWTPRAGDGFIPALADTGAYLGFKMGSGDVTLHDNISTWALWKVTPDETVWFAIELLKHDTAGSVRIWVGNSAEAASMLNGPPIASYTGPTNQHSPSSPFDPTRPNSLTADSPQRLDQHPCFSLGMMVYNGSVSPNAVFAIQSAGMMRLLSIADAQTALGGVPTPPPPPPPPPPPVPTPDQIIDGIVSNLSGTTVTHAAFKKAVAAGKYNPKDGSGTQWGKALAGLEQLRGLL